MKHTPGPWTYDVNEDGELLEIKAGNEWVLNGCGCCGSPWVSNVEDARLIAAAPDMLEALKSVVHWHGTRNTEDEEDGLLPIDQQTNGIDLAMAAIAKATGENNA